MKSVGLHCVVLSCCCLVMFSPAVLCSVMSRRVVLSRHGLLCQIVLYSVTLHYAAARRVVLPPLSLYQ